MNRFALCSLSIVCQGVLIGSAEDAHGFICSRVSSPVGIEVPCSGSGKDTLGASLSWFERSLPYTLDSAGTSRLQGSDELQILRDSFSPWEAAMQGAAATDMTFVETPLNGAAPVAGFDPIVGAPNANLFIFYDDLWPRPGQAKGVVALTTTTFDPQSGQIFDADIEFNSANFVFADLPACCPDACPAMCAGRTDLMNTTVHELGHFLGLAHADDSDSDAADPAIFGATMFSSSTSGEIKKRDLALDDIRGVLFKYPAGEPNGYCNDGQACGCCAPPFSSTKSSGSSGCAQGTLTSISRIGGSGITGVLLCLLLGCGLLRRSVCKGKDGH